MKVYPLSGIFLAVLILLSSCEKPPIVPVEYPHIVHTNSILYVLNEGNFQWGNASIDMYDYATGVLIDNAFEKKNNRSLGDVLQSLTRWGNTGYLVINNSQKIEVVDLPTMQSVASITGFKSPRYIVVQNPQKAYVSEYYNGGVKQVNLQTNQIEATVNIPGNCEEMLLLDHKLYVTVANARYVYIINTISNALMDSIPVAFGPNSLCLDANGYLWVLSSGIKNSNTIENGALQKIDPLLNQVMSSFLVTPQSEHGAIKLCINGKQNTLYWINKSVYKHAISASQLNQTPWIPSFTQSYWAINCDSLMDEVYVGDAIDYNQRSTVNRYTEDGTLRGTFKAGLITTDFYFWYK